jgi:lysophospholipase L1-like esterase
MQPQGEDRRMAKDPALRCGLRVMAASLSVAAAVCASAATMAKPIPAGARYVALGSSFASGAGVVPYVSSAPARCQRSQDNYAHQLARKRKLDLVDVSCGGATTAHLLGPWNELPPQLEAVTPETALVTITVGGNDLGYMGGLIVGSCDEAATSQLAAQPLCRRIAEGRRAGATLPAASQDAWRNVELALTNIAREIRRRAPRARIIFVDYQTVLPKAALCAQTPLSAAAAATARQTAARLAALTAQVARRNDAEVLRASILSENHDACARAPWVSGFIPPADAASFTPYHPNRAGMSALAQALDRQLRR